ncbi:iron-siderophore ABC transporter substrate-binding protein [Streptomyces sp. NPDC091279]|uniref:iron-siderophore ABC transporter substrate-binding protein n=1 Tax=Streptomyces sp. NPDC091279 TaxID=3365983 RepID=UPI0037F3A05C
MNYLSISPRLAPVADGSPRKRPRSAAAACLLTASALLLTGCGSGSSTGSATSASSGSSGSAADAQPDAGAYPVTIASKFGSATLKKQPTRVVALGWSDQDAALALGVRPVAVVKTEDSFEHGVGPWDQAALGSSRPEVLDTTDGYPVEKIAALHPDLILAVQSGLTSADYAKLSKIAPTVGYTKDRVAYGTPWQEQTRLIGKALGRGKEAEQAVTKVTDELKQDASTYPNLKGKTFIYAYPMPSTGSIVLYDDERTNLLKSVGMTLDPVVSKAKKLNTFAHRISSERTDELTSDALLVWYNTAKDQRQLESDATFSALPAVKNKAYAGMDRTEAQATSAPSVLSIPWVMKRLLPSLNAGLK